MTTDANHDSLIGEVLASRYRIEAPLGEGAMGAVYRARHIKVGRAFAIKVLHPRFSGEERTRKRFAREAEIAGTLRHPNVVSVVDVGDLADGRRFLVMEYAEGVTLLDVINETAPMSPQRVISLVRQLCNGLQHAHELGLIHRDFKPDNVIVERDRHGNETPRIVDFGTAILREDVESSTERLTTKGLVLGTPHYMSPEHATGQPIDHRIDLFALGVTCFEMMTGHSPFEGDGVDVARANLLQETPVMSERVPGLVVDPLLEAFTRKLMCKSRDDRPASAAAAREIIDLIEQDRRAAGILLGIVLDEPRPLTAPSQPVSQPIPFPVPVGEPVPVAAAMEWQAGPPPGAMAMSAPPVMMPAPGQVPDGVPPGWQAQPWTSPQPWQPPSPPPYSEYPRLRSQPEATEQMPPMRPLPWRLIIPAFAALAVLVTMVIAVRGHEQNKPTSRRVEYSSLGTASAEASTPVAPANPAPTANTAANNPSTAPPTNTAASATAPATDSVTASAPAPATATAPDGVAASATATAPNSVATSATAPDGVPASATASNPAPAAEPPARSDTKAPRAPQHTRADANDAPAPPKPAAARAAALPPPQSTHPITMPLSAAGVAELYASVGRQLKALDAARGASATAELWPLYLNIHINEVISDPTKLAGASTVLYHIEDQVSRRSAAR